MTAAKRASTARRRPAVGPPKPLNRSPSVRSAPGIWWRCGLIVVVGALTYANSLSAPFTLDDDLSIVTNQGIRQWWNLARLLRPEREVPVAGRPLVNVTFAINYAVGGLHVAGYHIVNIAIHLVCALVVFGVMRRTLELPSIDERLRRRATDLSFAAALIWTLHPLNSEVVDYLTERTESMMALFYLLTMYASIRAMRSARGGLWQAAAVLSCAGGMACKESMVTAPVMVALYDRIFAFDSFNAALRARWRLYVGLAASWLVLLALNWSGPRVHSAGLSTDVRPWTYLLNQNVMITRYLRLAVWPRSLVIHYGAPLPLTLVDVWPYGVLLVSLIALTVVMLVRRPQIGFLGAWFFVTLAPTSSVVPIATEVGAERRMYLPLVALIVLLVVAAWRLWTVAERRGVAALPVARAAPVAALVLVLVSGALVAGTIVRNREYASPLVMAQTVLDRWPSGVAHSMLGSALIAAGRHEEAMAELRQGAPTYPVARYNLGVELFNMGRLDAAIEELQTFVRQHPDLLEVVTARDIMGRAFALQSKWPEAAEQFRLLLVMRPANLDALRSLASALFAQQEYEEASVRLRQYLKFRPDDGAALTNLGIALVGSDKLEEAIAVFRRAVGSDPQRASNHRNLAMALLDHHDVDEAAEHAEQAVALAPDDPAAHDLLGRALAIQGRLDRAVAHFERALEIDPSYAEGREDLGRVLALKQGRPPRR